MSEHHEINHLTKRFGGLCAISKCEVKVEAGNTHGIIGPNGAGKTTLFNLITGIYKPTEGDIRFRGETISGLRPGRIALKGVGRTFQNIRLLKSQTVLENVRIAFDSQLHYSPLEAMLRVNRFGRDVTGIFAPNESSATGMLLAMKDAGLAGGKVKLVGFDSGAQTVAALKSGDLQGLVVQNPFQMGYLGVKTLVASLRGQKVALVIDTGCALVTRENMAAPAMAKRLSLPVLASTAGDKPSFVPTISPDPM